MQEEIPQRSHFPASSSSNNAGGTRGRRSTRFVVNTGRKDDVRRMVKENAVIVFAASECCMSHVVERLLQGLGIKPAVYEVEEGFEDVVAAELRRADDRGGGPEEFPVLFIGGRWFGGLERTMAAHITGELTPLLKQAGALWL